MRLYAAKSNILSNPSHGSPAARRVQNRWWWLENTSPRCSAVYIGAASKQHYFLSASFPLDCMLAQKKQEGALANNMCMLQSGVVKKAGKLSAAFHATLLESVPRGDFRIQLTFIILECFFILTVIYFQPNWIVILIKICVNGIFCQLLNFC